MPLTDLESVGPEPPTDGSGVRFIPSSMKTNSCGLQSDYEGASVDEEEANDDEEGTNDDKEGTSGDLLYSVDDIPPWHTCCFLGLQHCLTIITPAIAVSVLVSQFMCISDTDPARGQLVCTNIFVAGMITLLQTTFGVRLPIVQGTSSSFLVPTIAILTTSFPACENLPLANMTAEEKQEVWQVRIREVQGAIAVSAIFQIIIGFTGVVGLVITWITPLALAPTVTLIGLSLFDVAIDKASLHWGVSLLTMVLLILFSQCMKDISLPLPSYSRRSGFHTTWVHVFKLFPVVLSMLLSWGLCWVLTVAEVLPEDSKARTDLAGGLIRDSQWFSIPYPCQWGVPRVSVAGVCGMLGGILASVIESISDYYACASIAGAPPLPTHAVNRGICVEGVGCVLAGLWGTGNGTTSYSQNIGVIGVTKVSSRRVVQAAAVIMLLLGVFSKFGTVFAIIPEPVVGGMFCIMLSMVTAIGLSPLQYVDLDSSRNIFVVGFPLFFGLAFPKWLANNPGIIATGVPLLDQVLTVLLQTSMLLGGLLALILDNTLSGTPKERGLDKWNALFSSLESIDDVGKIQVAGDKPSCYDLPIGMNAIRRATWTRFFPISPTFRGFFKR